MRRLLSVLILLCNCIITAQTNNDVEVAIARKPKTWDTLKYQKFETVLIVGYYQQYRTFSHEFRQVINIDSSGMSAHTYSTEADYTGAVGLVFNYDKFQLSVSKVAAKPVAASKKGHTDIFNIGFNVGDNQWVSENYFRRFRGFYNTSTPSFDTTFKETGKYLLQPKMVSSLFMTRFMYFRNNENFSYKAGFGCNYRQLKSAASFVSGGSFSVFNLRNDSSLIPLKARYLYNDYGNMRGMRSVNLSYNIGIAATLVLFKAWFAAGYFTLGPEIQGRNYDLTANYRKITYLGWSGTGRFSFGLNMKKFYFIMAYTSDYNVYNSKKIMDYKTVCHTANATFGWRFHAHTPKFYQKFMGTKLYNMM